MTPEQTSNAASEDNKSGVAPLIAGIIKDAQVLISQQLMLVQTEIKNDLNRTKKASLPLIAGIVVAFLAGIFFFMTAVHFITWTWPHLDYSAAYTIVGVGMAVLGVTMMLISKAKFDRFNPLPEQTMAGLKENMQWQKKT